MELESEYRPEDSVYELFKDIERNTFEYIFRGNFTASLVMSILNLTRTNLDKLEDATQIKMKIQFIMGEGLQNITKHQDLPVDNGFDNSAIFSIQRKNQNYFITSGNFIHNKAIDILKGKLEKVNSLTVEELREYARHVRKTSGFTEKGGASLGLIEMAKRSGNKLLYRFKPINEEFSFFYLNTEIPTSKNDSEMEINSHGDENSLDNLIAFHDILNRENFILTFKGDFNQDNLLSLLSLVEGQMNESTTSIKVYNIMVELLQNIVKHADSRDGSNWKSGIFFINEKNNEFLLTAGNYIGNSKVDYFKEKLEFVNSLDNAQLQAYYNRVLLAFGEESSLKTGLGIIDIRKRSGKKLSFSFTQINDIYTFYTIQVAILKK